MTSSSLSAAASAPLSLLRRDPGAARRQVHLGLQQITDQGARRLERVEARVQRVTEAGLAAIGARTEHMLRALERLSVGQIGIGVLKPDEDAPRHAFRLDYAAEARVGAHVARERIAVTSFAGEDGRRRVSYGIARSAENEETGLSWTYRYGAQETAQATHFILDEELRGTAGADRVGAAEVAALTGGQFGRAGAWPSMDLGAGADVLTVSGALSDTAFMQVDLGAGDDVMTGALRYAQNVRGGGGDDAISLSVELEAAVRGGDGNDAISVTAQNLAEVYGDAGDDAISLTAVEARASGGTGDDALAVIAAQAEVDGGDGNDVLTVAAGRADLRGGAGDDVLNVAAERATAVRGGAGRDVLNVTAATGGVIDGGAGDDVISVQGGVFEAVTGGAGDDLVVVAEAEAKVVFGAGDGADVLRVEEGARVILMAEDPVSIEESDDGARLVTLGSGDTLRIEGAGEVIFGVAQDARPLVAAAGFDLRA
ncbi:hypothetical protein ACQ5SO_15115 [Rhodovulum sp. DZ06]|uniref:hypothetical protein n=1 Tax=Rhodovulum sp. DZ06 TaxID=3425126 RepID=UPI003D324F42